MTPETHHRIFIAVELPEAVIHEMMRAQRYFNKKELFDGKYPNPEVMHLTLKFIGEVSTHDLAVVRQLLAGINAKKMRLQIDTINYFGSPEYMKVIFAQLSSDAIADLVALIDQVLADFVKPEANQFVAHVTLARVKQVYDTPALLEAIELFALAPMIFSVDSFVLMESELTTDGPIHSVIERYSLD